MEQFSYLGDLSPLSGIFRNNFNCISNALDWVCRNLLFLLFSKFSLQTVKLICENTGFLLPV